MTKTRPPTARDVLRRIQAEEILFVDLKFTDLFGGLQHLTLLADTLDEGSFTRGLNFDGSSVRGFQAISQSDLLLRPDPASIFRDPFFDDPTLSMFCDVVNPKTQGPYSRDPRGVAKRAEIAARSLGIADAAYYGLESEFYVFDDVRYDQATQHGFYFINSDAAFWNSGAEAGRPNLGHRATKKRAYFASPPKDGFHNLRGKISLVLREMGMTIELHHHEVGAAGQNEIGVRFDTLSRSADNVIKFKYTVKNVAQRYGKTATFMPKPLFEEAGSGMHTNVSLFKNGKNAFFEPGCYADMSQVGHWFIGGLLKHAPAVCAFGNPSTNSYRRLVPGYEAPTNLVFSSRNRSACIRIPYTGDNPKTKRLEFRTPDPSANPYLSCAAVLMAGLDGIINRIDPPDPVDQDIYEYANSETGKLLRSVPTSLGEALDALEEDHEFLLRNGVFTRDLIDTWLRMKREHEINYLSLRPHPTEFSLYFDV
ncbi:MAG: type I glutamate--ammonia ligase [Deltaproteobacteria bacterium]|nr:type I glutamate--ammonia ligase [Deltaproteobacteria bacterium]